MYREWKGIEILKEYYIYLESTKTRGGTRNRWQGEESEDGKKVIILPVVLYGCATWSLTLREELRLRVFENRVLRIIFGIKMN
jgi:hypothetical protein